MKSRRISFLVMFALMSLVINAQKPNVYIDYFTRPSNISFGWAEALRSNVMQGINNNKRVELIDVDSKQALAIEQSRREQGSVVASEDVDRMKVMVTEGANFLISGNITSMVATKKSLNDGTIYYAGVVAYTLKVIDPNTGKTKNTMNFSHGDDLLESFTGDTPDEAVNKACEKAVVAMRKFVEETFPLRGSILEISKTKKDKAEEVYIDLGSDHGVIKGNAFEVGIEREVAGRKSFKKIGEIKVINVESEDLSLCDVKDGEKEIKAAIDGGQTLKIRSVYKKKLPTIDSFL